MAKRAKTVAVLMGGWSSAREVSLVSGAAVAEALNEVGYQATAIDVERDVEDLVHRLTPRPDVVFNALHGRYGEDGCIQGLLEILAVPYTHSGVLASALAMDKPMAKKLFADCGIRVAEHVVAGRDAVMAGGVMDPPYVIKPLNEGSSVGVCIVLDDADLAPLHGETWTFGAEVMVERYVAGREITVAVMGDRALAVTELRPVEGFYDYDAKYTEGRTEHLVPAPLPAAATEEAESFAVLAHDALGCRGVSRADLRYDDTRADPGEVYLLEINTQPGMTPLSLVPEQARHVDIDFTQLVSWMVENATCDG
jgi:D-alanine-D-alanine ligase